MQNRYPYDPKVYDRTLSFLAGRMRSNARTWLRRFLPVATRPRTLPGRNAKGPHWVICFYGIDRSLKYTRYGIQRHVFGPLQRLGVSATVVCHFNHVEQTREIQERKPWVGQSQDRIADLNPDILWIEPQDETLIEQELRQLDGFGWRPGDQVAPDAKRNLLFQLHSLSRAFHLLETCNLAHADLFFLCRADLQFLDDLDVGEIEKAIVQDGVDILTPDWQKWSGLNDRFCALSPRALSPIMNRRRLVGAFCKEYGHIHAETLLSYAVQQNDLRSGHISMRAERVRGTGRVRFEPFGYQ